MSKFPGGWLRAVHWNDPVPHVAPTYAGGVGYYHHVGRELWYDEGSDVFMVCDGSGEDPNCSASVAVALVVTDHFYYLGHKVTGCTPFQSK